MAMTVMMMMVFHHILLGLGLPQQIQTLSHLRTHLQDTLLSLQHHLHLHLHPGLLLQSSRERELPPLLSQLSPPKGSRLLLHLPPHLSQKLALLGATHCTGEQLQVSGGELSPSPLSAEQRGGHSLRSTGRVLQSSQTLMRIWRGSQLEMLMMRSVLMSWTS